MRPSGRWAARAGAATLGVLAAGGVAAGAAAAAPAVESGWWNEAAVGPVTAPSATPADQLQVSNGFSGPLAFAAVRYTLPGGTPSTDIVTLRLVVPPRSSVGTPAVSACPTTSAWKPGPDQAPRGAPGYSCRSGHQVDAKVSAGAESWAIPAVWAQQGALSVALVPTPGSTAPYSVTFTAPTAASLAVGPPPAPAAPVSPPAGSYTPAPATPPGSTPGAAPAAPLAAATTTPGPGAAAVAGPAPVLGSYAASPAPALGAAPAAGGTPAGPATPASAAAGASSRPAGGAPAVAGPGGGLAAARTGDRAGRVMAFCLLVALGLAAWFLAAQPDRAPRLLGPLTARMGLGGSQPAGGGPGAAGTAGAGAAGESGAPVRGVGRFARARTAPPRRI